MTDIDPIELGERIKKQRLLLGYSREKLAELADITPRFKQYVCKYFIKTFNSTSRFC